MKMNPTRFKGAGRNILRSRMMAEVFASTNGQRVIRECQETLSRPANSDEDSRALVLRRYAEEVNLYPHEMLELLGRKSVG
jgi:hypothetical protein